MKLPKVEVLLSMLRHAVVWGLLIAPVAVYVNTFGPTLSHEHNRWAEMGSAMSGIYGPILAALGFALLTVQLVLQKQTNKHMFDQAYIQTASADVAFYLSKLEVALNERTPDGVTLGLHMQSGYSYVTQEHLREPSVISDATALNRQYPQIFAAWNAIQCILGGLQAGDKSYNFPFTAAQQKASVVLSYAMCVTLDQFVWCVCQGRLKGPNLFSNLELPHMPT